MSCKEFEIQIYLYPELSEKERRQVDAHLQTCIGCNALFQELKQTQELINQMAEKKPVPVHAARLTGSIMSKIMEPVKPTWYEWVNDLLLSKKSKYVLSITSSLLLVVFFAQSLLDSPQIKMDNNDPFTNSVILNAKLFRDNFSRNRNKRALFADCRSPFQSNRYYRDCVKSKLK
jgi:hypothetical protein